MSNLSRFLALAGVLAVLSSSASASDRRFSYTYETTTAPKGTVELENRVTWKHTGVSKGSDEDVFQFRHEVEIGLTDHIQLGLYLFDWQYNRQDSDGHKARYQHSGAELIWNLSNPTTDFLGSAVYGEVLIGEKSVELEGKLLLQKNFGALTVAYNAALEAEWEGEDLHDEINGEFAQSLGVSYDLNKKFSVGAEVLHEIGIPNWKKAADSVLWVGPNASLRYGRVYLTLTALFQMTDVEGEADAQIRLITGFHF